MAQTSGTSRLVERTGLIAFLICLLFLRSAEAQSLEGWTQRLQIVGEAARYLQAIELKPIEHETTFEITSEIIRINLALGDTTAKSITLVPSSAADEFKIEQQYETSVSISAEGPHMDLVHWKHYLSPWSEIEKIGDLEFRSREVFGNEFPPTTQAEILEAARNELKLWSKQGFEAEESWIERAGQCEDPWTEPCGVGVSKVRLKIKVREAGEWKKIQTIEFVVPMGC
jgi:hypothetical protein